MPNGVIPVLSLMVSSSYPDKRMCRSIEERKNGGMREGAMGVRQSSECQGLIHQCLEV